MYIIHLAAVFGTSKGGRELRPPQTPTKLYVYVKCRKELLNGENKKENANENENHMVEP